MATKKLPKKKYANIEVWGIDSVTGDSDGTSKFTVQLRGRSKNSEQDFQIILLMDYYSLSAISDKVKTIIQKRVEFQTNALKNISQ